MKEEELTPDLLEALEATKRLTGNGIKPAKLAAIYQKLDLKSGGTGGRSWLMPVFGLAAITATALWFASVYVADDGPSFHIVRTSGTVQSAASHFEVAPDGELDVATGGRVRLALRGKSTLDLTSGRRARLSAGTAEIWVQPESGGFELKAGGALVIVHGTVFSVTVRNGTLTQASVGRGEIEVRNADGSSMHLAAGEAFPEGTKANVGAWLEGSWWESAQSPGSLRLTSEPSGAQVTLGGVEMGETPLYLGAIVGDVVIDLELPGYRSKRESFLVNPQQAAIEHVVLQPKLAVDDPAPALQPRRLSSMERATLWRRAEGHLAARRCDRLDAQAIGLFRRLPNKSEQAELRMLQAECRLRIGRRARARKLYEAVAGGFPNTASAEIALFELGKLLAETGRRRQALKRFEQYRSRYPSGRFIAAADFRRCELLAARHDNTAGSCLERFGRDYPKSPRRHDATLLRAGLLAQAGAFDRAAALYRAAADALLAPRQERALYLWVDALRRGGSSKLGGARALYLKRFPQGKHAEEVRALTP